MKQNKHYDDWDQFVAELRAKRKAQSRWMTFWTIVIAVGVVAVISA